MLVTGAGGFAMQLLDTLADLNLENEVVFFDDMPESEERLIYEKFVVINSIDKAIEHLKKDNRFVLGTGNPIVRKMFFDKFSSLGATPTSIISPSAYIGKFKVQLGLGVTILRNVTIESGAIIGNGSLINLNATITHGCRIGEFCEICPGVNIAGNVEVGDMCFLGTGSIILPNLSVGQSCTIAAGAVLINDFSDKNIIAGIPAISKQKL